MVKTCIHGWEHPDDKAGMAEIVSGCVECEIENCPVREILKKYEED